jgi:hypothetical protein
MQEQAARFKLETSADLRQTAAPHVLLPVGELADEPIDWMKWLASIAVEVTD